MGDRRCHKTMYGPNLYKTLSYNVYGLDLTIIQLLFSFGKYSNMKLYQLIPMVNKIALGNWSLIPIADSPWFIWDN